MTGYFKLLPVGRFIMYRGERLEVRSVWYGGIVCNNNTIIEGEEALKCITPI